MFLQLGEQPTVVISSTEAARTVLKTQETAFCSRPVSSTTKIFTYGGTDLVFAPYGEYWREMRKILTSEMLSSKQVQSFRAIREEEIHNLIQTISSMASHEQIIDLVEMTQVMACNISVRAITGSKSKNQPLLPTEIQKSSQFAAGLCLANLFPSSFLVSLISSAAVRKAAECHKSIDKLFDYMIQEYRNTGFDVEDNNLLKALLRLHDETTNKISMETVKAIVFDAVAGGTDSIGAALHWAMSELVKNPKVMMKAQNEVRQLRGRATITEADLAELNFVHCIIKETLRLHPLTLLPRECQETCKLSGYDIPKGTAVVVNLWAIGRDPMYWEDPEEFKPERFSIADAADSNGKQYLEFSPFGAGRRVCPGKSFGLAIVELTLANLLYHFNWELPYGQKPEELDMSETFGISVKRKSPLLLNALPYTCS